MNRRLVFYLLGIILFLTGACMTPQPLKQPASTMGIPQVQREFRAAWIATVANINWPSKPGLSVDVQKEEAIQLLDLLADHHYNAVIFQVRPQCDAFYPSDLEPWSYFLTGTQGLAPSPFYDPLDFWIKEAHRRGIELHVWLNPYRAHHTTGGEITEKSIVRTRPDLAVALQNGYWWLDPGKKETQEHSYQVAMDLVKRYDIDGVHFDDYFYPYPSYNDNDDFPDNDSYLAYQQKGGKLDKSDWRRQNVNDFIRKLYKGIKKEKKHIKFGISPFGIWRPGYPASIQGFDQYDQLYADAKLWLNKGWIDYFTPQLYWPINQIPQSFPVLLEWWQNENYKKRHLWPGLNVGRFQGKEAIDETINQIMISRALVKDSPGTIHWSIGPLVRNDSLIQNIFLGPYNHPALPPSSPWLSKKTPLINSMTRSNLSGKSILQIKTNAEFRIIVIYYLEDAIWNYKIIPCEDSEPEYSLIEPYLDATGRVLISIVDLYGNESRPTLFHSR